MDGWSDNETDGVIFPARTELGTALDTVGDQPAIRRTQDKTGLHLEAAQVERTYRTAVTKLC